MYHTVRKYSKIGAIVGFGLKLGLIHVITTIVKGNVDVLWNTLGTLHEVILALMK